MINPTSKALPAAVSDSKIISCALRRHPRSWSLLWEYDEFFNMRFTLAWIFKAEPGIEADINRKVPSPPRKFVRFRPPRKSNRGFELLGGAR